jgi:TonB family protein
MAAGVQTKAWQGESRRREPRFPVHVPLDVTVLRSGVPETVPGRAVNVCERGIAAMLAADLIPGETVGVEVRLPLSADAIRVRAAVRYQDKLQYGFEFVAISAEERGRIREWAKETKAKSSEPEGRALSTSKANETRFEKATSAAAKSGNPKRSHRRIVWIALLAVIAILVLSRWRWNLAWNELESDLKIAEVPASEPRLQVPAEMMERLLVHRVEPVYPAEARRQNLQGTIALDIIVGRDGSVVSMRALNGPDVLARAAMDALRWWKFEPYRVNGEPAVVETTVAVEFKP